MERCSDRALYLAESDLLLVMLAVLLTAAVEGLSDPLPEAVPDRADP